MAVTIIGGLTAIVLTATVSWQNKVSEASHAINDIAWRISY